ncbi:hypothetical protein TR13x_08840 [Caloranaerobacter sp. TR13]|uniref:ATP-binding protein n=1 Tax=Caloranaerobacter sp. TR13 TaxID=1302151 RepID=UPI0006D3B9BC|nr:ATP-binding protein [Caloranaerobacter sp. TR13]KPU26675.1 hypothetical protein TR13x_08840 [Caloranaerobacter sp. TR13]
MGKIKKMFFLAFSVTLISQFYFSFIVENFRISLAVIVFTFGLFWYKSLDTIVTSIVTSLTVFLFRYFLLSINHLSFEQSFAVNYPVLFFYMIFGICFHIFNLKNKEKNFLSLFIRVWACDFIANFCEILLRLDKITLTNITAAVKILFLVALVRTFISISLLSVIKYYKLLLIKEEHEDRYRKLVLLTSSLKSEIYFMKKNIDYIEKVMNNSFKLYEAISNDKTLSHLKNLSLSIAKDVHEIKKDYIRVIKGIEETTVRKIEYSSMSLKDIFYILQESTKRYLESENLNINLIFQVGDNFKTKEHYHIISLLRNLINNSIEAIKKTEESGFIMVVHYKKDGYHIFKVYDNGEGIREKDMKNIFDPGFSTKFNPETGDLNRGIGLTLVKDMVENYFKGKIIVNSKYKGGTVFQISIPEKVLEVDEN